ncbi:uncharacterized protein LOC133357963 isoform X2 [Lethenteron reissneri]|uniref:uncharacterized protein LOC133357963 isoform X2 n=1 Tax=Lethenteron reissneri TaxID=7753 RepID=UPI002AB6D186|nr:uncharacterized protein LOC133357963 isoform X2 [Lethenteron reissneri]
MEIYCIVIAFIVVKVLFYVCWYRSRQRQLHAFLHDPDHARILIIGGRPYAHPANQRHTSRVWYNWYSAREDGSPGSPSRSLTPAPSYSQLEPPPPPYDAIVRPHGSGELKPPPYSECVAALLPADDADAARIAGEAEASPPPPHAAIAAIADADSDDDDDYTDAPPPPYSAHADSSASTAVNGTATTDPVDAAATTTGPIATNGGNAALVSTNSTTNTTAINTTPTTEAVDSTTTATTATSVPIATSGDNAALVSTTTTTNTTPNHNRTTDTNATLASSTPTTPTAVASIVNSATADDGETRPSQDGGDDDNRLHEDPAVAVVVARHTTRPLLLRPLRAGEQPL